MSTPNTSSHQRGYTLSNTVLSYVTEERKREGKERREEGGIEGYLLCPLFSTIRLHKGGSVLPLF